MTTFTHTPAASTDVALHNPYLDAVSRLAYTGDGFVHEDGASGRLRLVRRYAWAVPTSEAVVTLADAGPLIELGAGLGYWAKLISDAGGDIVAFDAADPRSNVYCDGSLWFDVAAGSVEKLDEHPRRSLFLCWPPYNTRFAADALEAYRGDVFFYVGELNGCCGDKRFMDLLFHGWHLDRAVAIPRWDMVNDSLQVWHRQRHG